MCLKNQAGFWQTSRPWFCISEKRNRTPCVNPQTRKWTWCLTGSSHVVTVEILWGMAINFKDTCSYHPAELRLFSNCCRWRKHCWVGFRASLVLQHGRLDCATIGWCLFIIVYTSCANFMVYTLETFIATNEIKWMSSHRWVNVFIITSSLYVWVKMGSHSKHEILQLFCGHILWEPIISSFLPIPRHPRETSHITGAFAKAQPLRLWNSLGFMLVSPATKGLFVCQSHLFTSLYPRKTYGYPWDL